MPTPRLPALTHLRPCVRPLALASAMLLTGLGQAQAQNLQKLYESARTWDATYQSAKALADSAQYREAQARSLRWPTVGATASGTRADVDLPNLPPAIDGTKNSTTSGATISARQPLFNMTNSATISQAEKALAVAGLDLQSAEQDLILRVAQAYFDVLTAEVTLASARAAKVAITEQLASAKRNFEVGTATITDAREAQASFDRNTALEIAAENDLRSKQAALSQLVGMAQVQPNPLATPIDLLGLPDGDMDSWVNRAEAEHPLVRKAQLALDVARLETDKARAGHLPTLDAVGSVGTSRISSTTVPGSATGTTNNTAIGLQLNVPLFAGFAVQNRVKETLALESKAQADLDFARRAVTLATRQAYMGLQSGLAQAKALEAAEASSQLALEATQLGYKVGVRVNLDVLNAQTQLFTTRRDLAKARHDVLVSGLRLRQAAGQLVPADVEAVSRSLQP